MTYSGLGCATERGERWKLKSRREDADRARTAKAQTIGRVGNGEGGVLEV